jgi:hypothetical protein
MQTKNMIADFGSEPKCRNVPGKGRANWQFALFTLKTAWNESKQTASLLYQRSAISLFQGVASQHIELHGG